MKERGADEKSKKRGDWRIPLSYPIIFNQKPNSIKQTSSLLNASS